ncbi:MAG: hypothetical protein ACE5JL_15790, partial [Dehalococcoidia bacterium]
MGDKKCGYFLSVYLAMQEQRRPTFKKLCRTSIEAGIVRLRDLGAWPLPPAVRRLPWVRYNDFRDIPELDRFLEQLASDDKLASIYARGESRSELWYYFRLWERLFVRLLGETEGMALADEVFAKWYRSFLAELYEEIAVWRMIDTVTGLELRGVKLEFDEATRLEATPGWDLDSLVQGQYLDFSGAPPMGLDRATIVTTLKIPKREYAGSDGPYPHLLKTERSLAVIAAIRLLKPGVPRLHCHVTVHLSNFPLGTPSAYCRSEGNMVGDEEATTLDRNDLPIVRELWQELMLTRYKDHLPMRFKVNAMDVALGRFSRSYEHQSWMDDILDLTIALETLLRPQGDNTENLTHKIRSRSSWLLGRDDADSDSIYERVGVMYDIRSSYAHGGTPNEERLGK